MKPLVIIAGATAVGKTELSINLAKRINGEIISADSMQIYRGLNIGTAKITTEEMRGVRHYLIDEVNPDEEFNVYKFKSLAVRYIDEIISHGHIPIIAGGTGFYIQAVLYDINFPAGDFNKEYRESLERFAKEQGPSKLHRLLEKADPDAAAKIHENNIKRVIRALEFYHDTGDKISAHNKEQQNRNSPYNFAYFILNRRRAEIYERINRRVDFMIREGLTEEVKSLLKKGVSKEALSMQGLGYKEIISCLSGDCDLDTAIDKIKLNTRHFAKRQITWFKREKDTITLNYEDYDSDEMLEEISAVLKQKNII